MAIVSEEFTLGVTKNGDVLSGVIEIEDDLSFDYKKYCSFYFIKKLMQRNTIYPRFRIFVCNHDDSTRYEIPNEDKDIFMNKIIFLNLYDKNGFRPVLISQYRNYILY